ncbi:MAG: N-6 DNA methylase [Alphaproteobacteria bacterium]|nr:N-6 DNA methylase [Alphaproteobacteria bacterium]
MAPRSREAQLHADWIGMLQPDGLVVSVPVLEEMGLYAKRPQSDVEALREATPDDRLPDLATLAGLLGWPDRLLAEPADADRLDLADLRVTLRPTRVVRSRSDEVVAYVLWLDDDPDRSPSTDTWPASHTERFERLLTATGHPVGVLAHPGGVRLVYAPSGEAPGRLTFPIDALRAADGRLLVDALHMLLGARRLFTAPAGKGLLDVLKASRERQEQVTNQLASQVQEALAILLDGFDTADNRIDGALLRDVSHDGLYDGLTTVLLRLVFLLYAEDRGLLPSDHPVYAEHYSVAGLGEQLAAEAVAHGEAQSRRYGAWARLLSLFRMVWSGAHHRGLRLPPRQGDLFHPDSHPFLEGRPPSSQHTTDPVRVPPLDDAVVHGVLQRLLHLDGQRVSYRNLEVEQLGSVYENLMGFEVRRAATDAVQLKDGCWVELGELAEAEHPYLTLQDITGERNAKLRKQLPELGTLNPTGDIAMDRAAVAEALGPLLPKVVRRTRTGRHYLQPGAERRNSGSHYTPRSLTEPIVRHTLEPLLGDAPTPEQILDLRVCDPAMGSGAFLAEVVRQLGDALVAAWTRAGALPKDDHDPVLVARRKVAERCVYGVDKNSRAVQLARLSLWLITSAADLPFTFVDHNLKAGDALIGMSLDQVAQFSFDPKPKQQALQAERFKAAMAAATRMRAEITAEQRAMQFARDEHGRKKSFLRMAEEEVWDERRVADLLVACAWDAGSKKAFSDRLLRMGDLAWSWYPNEDKEPLPAEAQALVDALPMRPFHWWLEFPEVFGRKRPGFDAVVGNPPFGGKNLITEQNGEPYIKLLQALWPHAHGGSDFCAYFFLRTAPTIRAGGQFGLVATNTIKQGNTRDTGLKHLIDGGTCVIRVADRDTPWPTRGAAVVVDQVIGVRGTWNGEFLLDGAEVVAIGSDLTAGEDGVEPVALQANAGLCFQGSNVLGKGFVLEPEEALELLAEAPRRGEVLRPYQGGRELNSNVPPAVDEDVPCSRYVIAFGDRSVEESAAWPVLFERVRRLVKPERDGNNRPQYRQNWWWHAERRPGLYAKLTTVERCLVGSQVSKHLLWAFQPTNVTFSHVTNVACMPTWADFAVLQSRVHEKWARDRGSSMKTDLRYTPSTCFETFPFPDPSAAERDAMTTTGRALYEARHALMVAEQTGLTGVWNRVTDPYENRPAVQELRALRDAMDRAVLAAYGWDDLDPDDSEEIVRRLRKLNAERAAEEAAQAAEAAKKPPRRKGT